MTRLKTICLTLLLCIGWSSSTSLLAQSSSCTSQINLAVDRDCRFTVSLENLRTTGPAASSQSIKFQGVNTAFNFYGGSMTATLFDLYIPHGGTIQYQLYSSTDGQGTQTCWGEINFEIKIIPDPIITTREVMCSQPLPDLLTVAEYIDDIDILCSAPISDIFLSEETEGDVCTRLITIRKISGVVNYGSGTKVTTPLVIDTIIEMPLDTGMIVCPFGGPNKLDAILLHCDDIGDVYPTPEVVEEYAPRGVRDAYPYIPKGLDTTIVLVNTLITIPDTAYEQSLITGDDGNDYWVTTHVITQRDTVVMVPDTTIEDIVIVLRPGPTCNLSVKYTDEAFPGCAGPDSKIMRTWNILDWCNGSIKECVQWIIVETAGPIIEPHDDVYVGIAPWVCTAQYQLSADVDRGCSETLEVIFQSTVGIIEDNKVLSGIWLNEPALVTVTAIDDCGQRAVDSFYVTPVDSIAPVAIAEDQVNVSLSGDPLINETIEDRGVAKVYVDAIDAGSHNSGCGDVTNCLLLKEELENPVIIDGVQAEVDGQLIYHSFGCLYDGILPAVPATKLDPGSPEMPYVYCKEYVKFCCESLGLNSVAMVVTNGGAREARTWTDVLVEDKSSPIVICPLPFKVGCEEEFEIPEPTIFNGVCSIDILEMSMTEDFDNCGDGIKTVTWTRNGEVICTIEITVDASSAFNPYEIKWPKHYTGDILAGIRRECELLVDDDGFAILDDDDQEQYVIVEYSDDIPMGESFECTEGGLTGEPVWCNSTCGLIGVNFEDQTVEAIDACNKLIREWTIIDWCSWDTNSDNIDDENDSSDSFTAITDEWLGEGNWLTDSRTTLGNVCEECEKPAGSADFVYFRYDLVDVDGYYSFTQLIKIVDFDDPVVTAPDTIRLSINGGATAKGEDFDDCVTSDVINASVVDFCGETEIDVSNAAWFIEVFALNDGEEESLGTKNSFGMDAAMDTRVGHSGDVHLIKWLVQDGCGNIGRAETYVLFIEDKNPTPLCIQTLSTSTMSTDGSSTIWAADFDAGSFDNCSEVDLLFKDKEGNFTPSLLFTCADIANGVNQVFDLELYAVDALGNFDFCNVSLRVDDFSDNCPDASGANQDEEGLSGSVATAFGDMVEDVQVSLNVGMADLTSVEGKYAFVDLAYEDFEIRAQKEDDYTNGVTSLDVVLIQRHLLGIGLFDSPYKVIASDINNDGRISALDLVDLKKLILGVFAELPRNESWRFVDASQRFEDPLLPFPFQEFISIENFDGSIQGQNFRGVKIGDVNGNAIANSLLTADNRSVGRLDIVIDDATFKAGEIFEVSVRSNNFKDIVAYQYTMELSGIQFVEATAGSIVVDASNFGMLDNQTVTTSWFSPEGITSAEDLYTMTFRALKDIRISEALDFTSRVTQAIAYKSNQDALDIGIAYSSTNSDDGRLAINQNVPNPFVNSTIIGFELPNDGQVTLAVFDVTGRSVFEIGGSYEQGYNEIIVDKRSLDGSGVLYYRIEYQSAANGSSQYTTIKRMVLIK